MTPSTPNGSSDRSAPGGYIRSRYTCERFRSAARIAMGAASGRRGSEEPWPPTKSRSPSRQPGIRQRNPGYRAKSQRQCRHFRYARPSALTSAVRQASLPARSEAVRARHSHFWFAVGPTNVLLRSRNVGHGLLTEPAALPDMSRQPTTRLVRIRPAQRHSPSAGITMRRQVRGWTGGQGVGVRTKGDARSCYRLDASTG